MKLVLRHLDMQRLRHLLFGLASGTGRGHCQGGRDTGRREEQVAVAGQASPVDEVSSSVGHKLPAVSTLTHMRTERLVRLIESGDDLSALESE